MMEPINDSLSIANSVKFRDEMTRAAAKRLWSDTLQWYARRLELDEEQLAQDPLFKHLGQVIFKKTTTPVPADVWGPGAAAAVGPQGVEVVVAVLEDNNYNAATPEFAGSWRDSYALTFPVVADTDFKLGAYYDPSLTPMAMLVHVQTMTIVNIQIGAQPATLEALIQSQL